MNTNDMFTTFRRGLPAVLLLLAAGVVQALDVTGSLLTKDDKTFAGIICWKAVARVYTVTMGKIEIEIALDKVAKLTVAEPAGLREALKATQDGKPQQAIPVLERILPDYIMLQWDEIIARGLADAYIKTGNDAGAVRACEKIISVKPEAAYAGEMAPLYWQALLKIGRTSKLDDLLDQAIKTGIQEAAANALIMRGDLLAAKGEHKAALKDGYLRVVTLFKNVRSAQAEALFKAAKAFEQLNQVSRAEVLRKQLLSEYSNSEWARQIKGGP